jgi:hypothetical protein
MSDVEKPVPPTVTATNSNPIKVAAAPPAKMKKLSQLFGIGEQYCVFGRGEGGNRKAVAIRR